MIKVNTPSVPIPKTSFSDNQSNKNSIKNSSSSNKFNTHSKNSSSRWIIPSELQQNFKEQSNNSINPRNFNRHHIRRGPISSTFTSQSFTSSDDENDNSQSENNNNDNKSEFRSSVLIPIKPNAAEKYQTITITSQYKKRQQVNNIMSITPTENNNHLDNAARLENYAMN